MTLQEIRGKHPFPWRYVTTGIVVNGSQQLVVIDAEGREVGFGPMLEFLVIVTNHMNQFPPTAAPSPAPAQA